jgi:type VI secretion system secreted protein Hcp
MNPARIARLGRATERRGRRKGDPMSIFTRGADSFEHTEANRREVLLAAGGVAAASALAGHTADRNRPAPKPNTLVIDDPDFTPITVLAWSWGVSNSGTTHIGGGSGVGKANFQDISITKLADINSPRLFLAVATGEHFRKATLTWHDVKGGHTATFVLDEVLVTSMSSGGSAGNGPDTDNVSLNFAKVKFSLDTASATYDIAKNSGA